MAEDLRAGHEALLLYDVGGPPQWHVRLLFAHVDADLWVVCTPDYAAFVEQLSMANPDPDGGRYRSTRLAVPPREEPRDIDDFPILIDGSPQVMLFAIDSDEDFVDVESVAVASVLSPQSPTVDRTELDTPETNRFSADSDASFDK